MAVILGAISLVSLGAAVFLAGSNEGEYTFRYGVVGILSLIYSAAGMVMGLMTVGKPDYYKFFPILAILLNGASLAMAGLILYMGVYS